MGNLLGSVTVSLNYCGDCVQLIVVHEIGLSFLFWFCIRSKSELWVRVKCEQSVIYVAGLMRLKVYSYTRL